MKEVVPQIYERLLRLLRWRLWFIEKLRPSPWQETLFWAAGAGVLGALAALAFRGGINLIHLVLTGVSRAFAGPALRSFVPLLVSKHQLPRAIAISSSSFQVAVIGVPDETHGEEIWAVAVLDKDTSVTEDELVAWSREQLGRHKYPRQVRFVDELPVGPSHKVLKRELRRTFGG